MKCTKHYKTHLNCKSVFNILLKRLIKPIMIHLNVKSDSHADGNADSFYPCTLVHFLKLFLGIVFSAMPISSEKGKDASFECIYRYTICIIRHIKLNTFHWFNNIKNKWCSMYVKRKGYLKTRDILRQVCIRWNVFD